MGFDPTGSMSVLRALENSPAVRSGLQTGDRVLAVNGVSVAKLKTDAPARIRGETGSSVTLTVRRGESEFDAVLTREEITVPPRSVVGIGVTLAASKKGEPMIQTVLPNSPASEAALRSGDVIVSVDGKPLGKAADGAIQGLLRGEEGVPVMVGIRRGGLVTDYSITRLRFVPGC
jgi:C-terminal processing protease CtpA/Prc